MLGGIYRVRRDWAGGHRMIRAGRMIDWPSASVQELWLLHGDHRPAVRQRASREFVRRADSEEVQRFVTTWAKRRRPRLDFDRSVQTAGFTLAMCARPHLPGRGRLGSSIRPMPVLRSASY